MAAVRFADPIDLAAVYESGQTFCWERAGDGWVACPEGRPAFFRQDGQGLLIQADDPDEAFFRAYFHLDYDLLALRGRLCGDEPALAALNACPGLRLLRQPFFETLCAFLLSQNNNIARIRASMRHIARKGRKMEAFGHEAWAFPGPEGVLALQESGLREAGAGYRAPYLLAAARAVAEGFDHASLAALPREEARARLVALRGVGPKVADCVLLFACGRLDACPVDVWIERALSPLFPRAKGREGLCRAAQERWGADAGYVQQALFYSQRMQAQAGRGARASGGRA